MEQNKYLGYESFEIKLPPKGKELKGEFLKLTERLKLFFYNSYQIIRGRSIRMTDWEYKEIKPD